MIGVNSITRNLIIPSVKNPEYSFEVLVQANKNLGIIDIILPNRPTAPVAPTNTSDGGMVRAYNEAKKEYLADMYAYKQKRSRMLNLVQGRDIRDIDSLNMLGRALYNLLNEE